MDLSVGRKRHEQNFMIFLIPIEFRAPTILVPSISVHPLIVQAFNFHAPLYNLEFSFKFDIHKFPLYKHGPFNFSRIDPRIDRARNCDGYTVIKGFAIIYMEKSHIF